jgi:hypothetical protein
MPFRENSTIMINQMGFEVIVGPGPENSLDIGIERSY